MGNRFFQLFIGSSVASELLLANDDSLAKRTKVRIRVIPVACAQ